jgi:hypothetical protein
MQIPEEQQQLHAQKFTPSGEQQNPQQQLIGQQPPKSVSPHHEELVVVVCCSCGPDSDNLLVCDSCHCVFAESPYDVDVQI